jgi:hypothetical protein
VKNRAFIQTRAGRYTQIVRRGFHFIGFEVAKFQGFKERDDFDLALDFESRKR